MKTEFSTEYRVSQRVVLRVGDKFRAKGGPYWKNSEGQKEKYGATGPFIFQRHCKRGSREWIEALDKTGQFAVLHIKGRRPASAGLVPRPYTIIGKTRRCLDTRR